LDSERDIETPQGKRHWRKVMNKILHAVAKSSGECCDFCTAEPIQKLYRCGNFVFQRQNIFPRGSVGEWAACRDCALLIANENGTA
jgi:hypothetical protein